MKNLKLISFAIALTLSFSAHAAELKPGQWDMAVTMEMKGMPQISAADMAEMKKMGIQIPFAGGEPIHVQQCITPEQATLKQPIDTSQANDGCKVQNYKHSGKKVTGDMVCTGDLKAKGKFEMTVNSDTSYNGKWSLKGVTKEGQPMDQTSDITGKWVQATCDARTKTFGRK
jgi:hypothetical protein